MSAPSSMANRLCSIEADRLWFEMECCNAYLARIGDPQITDAIVDELSDVLELSRKRVLCFARYGRLTGLSGHRDRTFLLGGAPSGEPSFQAVSFFGGR